MKEKPDWKIGDAVWYRPSMKFWYRAVVASRPRLLNGTTWVCALEDLPREYAEDTGKHASRRDAGAAECAERVCRRAPDDQRTKTDLP